MGSKRENTGRDHSHPVECYSIRPAKLFLCLLNCSTSPPCPALRPTFLPCRTNHVSRMKLRHTSQDRPLRCALSRSLRTQRTDQLQRHILSMDLEHAPSAPASPASPESPRFQHLQHLPPSPNWKSVANTNTSTSRKRIKLSPSADTPTQTQTQIQTPQSRKGRACTACRKLKVKCDAAERGIVGCSRCQRLGIECINVRSLRIAVEGEDGCVRNVQLCRWYSHD